MFAGVKDCSDGSDEAKRSENRGSGEVLSLPRRFGNHGRNEVMSGAARGALLRGNGGLSVGAADQNVSLPFIEMAFIIPLSLILMCIILRVTKCGRKAWKLICCLRR